MGPPKKLESWFALAILANSRAPSASSTSGICACNNISRILSLPGSVPHPGPAITTSQHSDENESSENTRTIALSPIVAR